MRGFTPTGTAADRLAAVKARQKAWTHLTLALAYRGTGLLEEAHVACVEGDAFGSAGAGFVRFSFAASVDRIREAVDRMRALLAG